MTTPPSLASTLESYQQALIDFEQVTSKRSPAQGLALLLARDAVQLALRETTAMAALSLLRLDHLDNRLREQVTAIAQVVNLGRWRQFVKPSTEAWWWFGDRPAQPPWWERFDWVWNALTLTSLTASVSLVVDTSSRFLSGGLDFSGAFAIIVQSVLTLISGGSLTKTGRQARNTVFASFKVPKRYWEEVSFAIALTLLIVLIGFRASLPQLAVFFNNRGVENYQASQLDSALSDYQRATALKPDYAEAHYHLGLVHEDLQQVEAAIAQYQMAVQSDADALSDMARLKAYNNLGRLYLLQEDYREAVSPFLNGLELIEDEAMATDVQLQKTKYALLKNLGWVQLKQEHYQEAEALLHEAINLFPQEAPAHCLSAQVFEAQEKSAQAWKSWQDCIRYADPNQPDEFQWLGLAREKTAGPKPTP